MSAITTTSDITVRLIQSVGGDSLVVAAAKVSTCGEEALKFVNQEANYGLLNFLMKMKHGTPWEHGSLTFFVHAPIFVFREMMRHRIGFSYSETSARYRKLEPVFWVPRPDRKVAPASDHKPARPAFQAVTPEVHQQTVWALQGAYGHCWDYYCILLAQGIAGEVARACLPVGIYSSCWVTCNPRSLMHFLSLRTHDPAAKYVSYPQAEIEEVARVAEEFLAKGWPLTYRAFNENGRVAP